MDFYWRRSGGTLREADPERGVAMLDAEVAPVNSWDEFLNRRLSIDVDGLIPAPARTALDALPASVHLLGDRVPLSYEVEPAGGVVRLRLKEGQARRLKERDLPTLDRPVRFTVLRGAREAVRADGLEDLRRQLAALPEADRRAGGGRRRR